jgi:hypothetical protein
MALLVTAVTLLPALVAISLAWSGARDVLVRPSGDPAWLLGTSIALGLFVAVWVMGLVLVGLGSAVRTAIWTADALR